MERSLSKFDSSFHDVSVRPLVFKNLKAGYWSAGRFDSNDEKLIAEFLL